MQEVRRETTPEDLPGPQVALVPPLPVYYLVVRLNHPPEVLGIPDPLVSGKKTTLRRCRVRCVAVVFYSKSEIVQVLVDL